MNTNFKRFLQRSLPKKSLQTFYEKIYLFALAGMNYGNGNFETSGELRILGHLRQRFSNIDSIVIFDVGGNIGNYASRLALFFNNSTVHSFEPSKKTFEEFKKNTLGHQNVVANNFGFGDAPSTLQLFSDKEASGLASVYHRNLDHLGIQMTNSEEIRIETIDNYCKSNNIQRIHFLKLDVEGHELKALKGAEIMLKNRQIDFIQFEFGGSNIDSRTYFQDFFYLLKDSFRIYRIVGDGLVEIKQYKEMYEIFITVNFLAERIT